MPLPQFIRANRIHLAGSIASVSPGSTPAGLSVMGPALGGALSPTGPATAPTSGVAAPPVVHALAFTMQVQEETNWCWAAVAVSTGHFYAAAGGVPTQCHLATAELAGKGVGVCCPARVNPACDIPWYLHTALVRLGRYHGYLATAANYASQLVPQIAAGRPVAFRIDWGAGTGHFVMVSGYDQTGGSQIVTVDDPAPATSGGLSPQRHIMDYATFTSAYLGTGSVSDTLWTI